MPGQRGRPMKYPQLVALEPGASVVIPWEYTGELVGSIQRPVVKPFGYASVYAYGRKTGRSFHINYGTTASLGPTVTRLS